MLHSIQWKHIQTGRRYAVKGDKESIEEIESIILKDQDYIDISIWTQDVHGNWYKVRHVRN